MRYPLSISFFDTLPPNDMSAIDRMGINLHAIDMSHRKTNTTADRNSLTENNFESHNSQNAAAFSDCVIFHHSFTEFQFRHSESVKPSASMTSCKLRGQKAALLPPRTSRLMTSVRTKHCDSSIVDGAALTGVR